MDKNFKEKLIKNVKKEVKQIMEEAVTRKFVHEESSSITSLCAAVEACLSQGVRRRALGLFKTNSTTALLHKIAKSCPAADKISRMVLEMENADTLNRKSSSSGDSISKPIPPPLLKKNSSSILSQTHYTPPKYLWIRLALVEKQLAEIINFLVENSSKYYEKDSLVADPDYGSILSSLLVGPCALDYSKTKTQDHYWTDPPANELVQRHRISSCTTSGPPTAPLQFGRSLHTGGSAEDGFSQVPRSAKDYVESLHQNSKTTLLYGKNNVTVHPPQSDPMPGYLSLHQSAQGLVIKWTPNQLMNGFADSTINSANGTGNDGKEEYTDKSQYWQYALNLRVEDIIYVHCHQQGDGEGGGTVVLVGQDGVQRPPIRFPPGQGHMLSFLSCLETGLLPLGQLDPPLWSQRGKGKAFPRVRRRSSPSSAFNEETVDYVFRIVNKASQDDLLMNQEIMDPSYRRGDVQIWRVLSSSASGSNGDSPHTSDSTNPPDSPASVNLKEQGNGHPIHLLCQTMKRQIISRAFYGWLAYCRHLSTVRTHLSGLVNLNIVEGSPEDEKGLTIEVWQELSKDGCVVDKEKVLRLVYYGGIAPELRGEVWPYLLGHYEWGCSSNEKQELDDLTRQNYEATMSEWLAAETVTTQRERNGSESSAGSNDGDEDEIVESDVEDPLEPGDVPTSPVSSQGGIYSKELLDLFALNLHRIDKDVQRCDRNYWYFASSENLEKLRNVMCTYVWERLEAGYMQGMCDLVAPLLVIFDDEAKTYACFCRLMERMTANFPHGGAMDIHFANLRSLIQILDAELYELMHHHGDYTHFYFCYRWFLLDFKRELMYEDVFMVWEVIWAARHIASNHFVLFLALALVQTYRDIILSNAMDFTDIIKFFNEMAERHNARAVLGLSRKLVLQLQTIIENK
ncbi:small G protein signaling modulator 1 [Orussus abietinus]|uniref:small G protein signaling modulator 1 n=1 Tax=Orussus abietinus TaxID=222816 RepID=UPI0006266449|nr:small G protein signaling modulator 1 [Orussus abietinus]